MNRTISSLLVLVAMFAAPALMAQTLTGVVSDENGEITFTPDVAGRYVMKANYKGELKGNPLADKASSNVHLTFEALLQ